MRERMIVQIMSEEELMGTPNLEISQMESSKRMIYRVQGMNVGSMHDDMVAKLCGRRFVTVPYSRNLALLQGKFCECENCSYYVPLWVIKEVWKDMGMYKMLVWRKGESEGDVKEALKQI